MVIRKRVEGEVDYNTASSPKSRPSEPMESRRTFSSRRSNYTVVIPSTRRRNSSKGFRSARG
jgi:hypothetical protein